MFSTDLCYSIFFIEEISSFGGPELLEFNWEKELFWEILLELWLFDWTWGGFFLTAGTSEFLELRD